MTQDEVQDAGLRAIAQRLGRQAAEQLDVDRVAAGVLQRLRGQPGARVWWMQPIWLRLAAGVVLMLGTAVLVRDSATNRPACPAAICATDDGVSLSSDQLRAVLRSIGGPDVTDSEIEPTEPPSDAGLEELNATQLQELLHSLEG